MSGPEYRPKTCRSCGAAIIWIVTPEREWVALDAKPQRIELAHDPSYFFGYASHAETCSEPDGKDRVTADGTPEHGVGARVAKKGEEQSGRVQSVAYDADSMTFRYDVKWDFGLTTSHLQGDLCHEPIPEHGVGARVAKKGEERSGCVQSVAYAADERTFHYVVKWDFGPTTSHLQGDLHHEPLPEHYP